MLALPLLALIVCRSAGADEKTSRYAAITVWGVYCWATGYAPATIVAAILPVFYLACGVASAMTVFSPWATTVPWLCFGGLLFGQMLFKSGLTTRLSYKCMLLAGDSFLRVLIGIMAAGFLIGPFIPTVLGKATIFFILGNSICVVLKLAPDSRESATIMLTCLFAVTGPSYATLTSVAHVPVAVQLMEGTAMLRVTWLDYAWHNFLPSLVYTLISFLTIVAVLRPGRLEGLSDVIRERYSELGPMKSAEKKAIAVLLVTILLFATESLHAVNAAWCIMGIAFLLFCPGLNLLDNSDIDKVSLSLLYFLSGAMSVGAVAADIGVAERIAGFAGQFLQGQATVFYLAGSFFLGAAAVLFLSPTTGMAAMSTPLTAIAQQTGIDPRPLLYSFCYGMDMYFMVYQYGITILLYSYQRVDSRYFSAVLLVKILLSALILLPFCLVYWHIIGLW